MKNKKLSLLWTWPLKACLYFLIITEILFFIGPIEYDIDNSILLILYFIILNFALYRGYGKGVSKIQRYMHAFPQKINYKLLVIIGAFILLYNVTDQFGTLSIVTIFEKVLYGIKNTGDVYYERQEYKFSLVSYAFNFFSSPVLLYSLVFGIFFFKKMSILLRFVLVFMIILYISSWLAIGVRKGIFDMILIIVVVFLSSKNDFLANDRKRRLFMITVFTFILCFISYFVYSNLGRYAQYDSLVQMKDLYSIKEPYLILPDSITVSLCNVECYLCQGYIALSKALDVGIIPIHPLCTNLFTINVAEKFMSNVMAGSYLDILEKLYNIDPLINWHSAYVWWANGVTLFGVPFVIYFIGYGLGRTWNDIIHKVNIFAVPLFVLFFEVTFYLYANNQIFSFSFGEISITFLLYIFSTNRNKYQYFSQKLYQNKED